MGAALLDDLIERLGAKVERASQTESRSKATPLGWPEIDALLPDGGLPRGVVELASPRALGGSTSIALAAIAAAHANDGRAWCAWIDPEATLYAAGVARAKVDLERLLVVQPPRADLGRIAVKVALSGAFEIVVVDVDPIAGVPVAAAPRSKKKQLAPEVVVRKLALAAEQTGTTVLLVTDTKIARAAPWPVALRLELSRPSQRAISLRVAKDRRGRIGLAKTVPFTPRAAQKVG